MGQFIFEGSQILFQQLFLPVAIVLCAGSVQSLAGGETTSGEQGDGDVSSHFADCNGNVALLFTVVAFDLVQVSRQLESVTALAYVSSALNVLMTLAIAIEVCTQAAPATVAAPSSADIGAYSGLNNTAYNSDTVAPMAAANGQERETASYELFVGMGHHPARYHWSSILGALGTFVYSCLPSCIVVETMAALRPADRPRMKLAVDASFVAYAWIYCVAGIPAVVRWGGDQPEPLALGRSPLAVFVKLALITGTGLDFVLASITVNRWAVRRMDPNFDYRWTRRNALLWAGYCLPSSLLAVAMALFVPRLESLTGLLNSLAGATLQVTATPLCLWLTSNAKVRAMQVREGGARGWRFASMAALGILFTLAVFLSACYNIATTCYIPGPGETFWCDLAG